MIHKADKMSSVDFESVHAHRVVLENTPRLPCIVLYLQIELCCPTCLSKINCINTIIHVNVANK